MVTASVTEARRNLTKLIERARKGEDVLIIKDSRPVAAITPVDGSDLELSLKVTDYQAKRLWELAARKTGESFSSAQEAVKFLQRRTTAKR